MNGVEVLSQLERTPSPMYFIALIAAFSGIYFSCSLFNHCRKHEKWKSKFHKIFACIGIWILIIIFTFSFIVCLFEFCYPNENYTLGYETKYKVIVFDEVKFNDFMNKYKIKDIDGKIYTVVEKEDKKIK